MSYTPRLLSDSVTFNSLLQTVVSENAFDHIGVVPIGLFTSVSSLLIPSDITMVRTSGYAAVGDGGEGAYRRVAQQPSHPGRLQDGTGAWFELVSRVVRPEMWGGFPSSANCSTAAQNAFDYAGAVLFGADVEFGPFTYNVGDVVPKNGTRIRGSGQLSTRLVRALAPNATTLAAGVLSLQPLATNIMISDLSLDGQSASDIQPLLRLGNPISDITIERVGLFNGMNRWAIRMDQLTGQTYSNVTVRGCRWSNCPNGGLIFLPGAKGNREIIITDNWLDQVGSNIISVYDSRANGETIGLNSNFDVHIDRNRITNCLNTGANGPIPVEAWGCTGITQCDNYIDSGTRGLTGGAGMTDGIIARNIILNQTAYACEAGISQNVVFSDNLAINCRSLISFTNTTGGVSNYTIENNRAYGSGLTAYSSSNPSSMIKIDGILITDVFIRGNRIYDPEYCSSAIRVVVAAGSRVEVEDNSIYGRTAYSALSGIAVSVIASGVAQTGVRRNRVIRTADLPSDHYQFAAGAAQIGVPISNATGAQHTVADNICRMTGALGTSTNFFAIGANTSATAMFGLEVLRNKVAGAYSMAAIFIPDNSGNTRVIDNDTSTLTSTPYNLNAAIVARRTGRTIEGTAAPTTGSWSVGDLCINSAPTSSSPMLWQCTTAGTPGTWVARYATGSDPAIPSTYALLSTLTNTPRLLAYGSSTSNVLKIRSEVTGSSGQTPAQFKVRWSGRNNNAPRGGEVLLQFGTYSSATAVPITKTTPIDTNDVTIASATDGNGRMEVTITFPTNAGTDVILEGLTYRGTSFATYSAQLA